MTSVGIFFLCRVRGKAPARFAFVLIGFVHLCYQWPLVLFSTVVVERIQTAWSLGIFVHVFVLANLLWLFLTRRMDPPGAFAQAEGFKIQDVLAGLIVIIPLVVVYLSKVPFSCTALYALLFDPQLTLLAREFSLKFVGMAAAAYSYGAVANVAAPFLVSMSFMVGVIAIRKGQYIYAVAMVAVFVGAVLSALLIGAKGMLIPSILMLTVTVALWNNSWFMRFVGVLSSLVFLGCILVAFELSKERGNSVGRNYDFASCSLQMGVCEKSAQLLESVGARKVISLGISHNVLDYLKERLDIGCSGKDLSLYPLKTFPNDVKLGAVEKKGAEQNKGAERSRGVIYAEALFYRAFVTPFQVSIWHNMYVLDHGSPGMGALPLANRFLDKHINMPEQVFQHYASVYLGGDKTSTGTAPTGFMMAYPAYWGLLGLLLAVSVVLVVDVVFSLLMAFCPSRLRPLAVGLMVVSSYNFLISDFGTVLLSHGLIAGWIILFLMSFVDKLKQRDRNAV
ncbi:hypothetical protein [Bdellovibrio bacteriovorus]|uniref:hypothetical protein n=1 Tax=Bdellovibrio bacteriovorus TaxID=959 RepID=UPI00155E5CCF|nr:hypothetical protein [Bdellovibrio bacteriovorus]